MGSVSGGRVRLDQMRSAKWPLQWSSSSNAHRSKSSREVFWKKVETIQYCCRIPSPPGHSSAKSWSQPSDQFIQHRRCRPLSIFLRNLFYIDGFWNGKVKLVQAEHGKRRIIIIKMDEAFCLYFMSQRTRSRPPTTEPALRRFQTNSQCSWKGKDAGETLLPDVEEENF